MIFGRLGLASLTAIGLVVLVGGCSANEEEEGPPKPSVVEFRGEISPPLVGRWKTKLGDSTLDLGKDGKLVVESVTAGPTGKAKGKAEGEWRVDSDRLILRYSAPGGGLQTVSYSLKSSGNQMTLSTKIPKRDTVYTRS